MQRQPSPAQPQAGMPVNPSNEMQGVPIAYRQEDGSETPAPVIDSSHRRAYYPPREDENNNSNHDSHYNSNNASHATNRNSGSSVDPISSPHSSATPSAARHPPPSALPAPAREGCTADTTAASAHSDRSGRETTSAEVANSAGVRYDSVVKPIFSPFQKLREQQEQEQEQEQQPYSQNSAKSIDAAAAAAPAAQASSPYGPPTTYAYAYAQPQQQFSSQPASAYGASPQYSTYMDSALVTGTTASSSYQSHLYAQPAQPYGGSNLPNADSAIHTAGSTLYLDEVSNPAEVSAILTEAQRMHDSPEWNTGLFGLNLDVRSSIDAFLCGYCISSAHFNVLYREEQGIYAPMVVGLLCVDICWADQTLPWLCPWAALGVHTLVIRQEVRKRYGVHGNRFIVKTGAEGGQAPARDVTIEGTEMNPVGANNNSGADAAAAPQSQAQADTAAAVEGGAAAQAEDAPDTCGTNANTPAANVAAQPPTAAAPTAASAEEEGSQLASRTRRVMESVAPIVRNQWADCVADALISFACTGCAIAQHHRELSLRGEWPGKVVFSRECFCGRRDQEPTGVPVTVMF